MEGGGSVQIGGIRKHSRQDILKLCRSKVPQHPEKMALPALDVLEADDLWREYVNSEITPPTRYQRSQKGRAFHEPVCRKPDSC